MTDGLGEINRNSAEYGTHLNISMTIKKIYTNILGRIFVFYGVYFILNSLGAWRFPEKYWVWNGVHSAS
jgi:hypothetical protein